MTDTSDRGDGSRYPLSELRTSLHLLSAPPGDSTVECAFRYGTDGPLAVRLEFHVSSDVHVTWVVGRDVLIAGVQGLSGNGDFKAWPSRARSGTPLLYLRLERPQGNATFAADLSEVRGWLEHTCELVPAGAEDTLLDWDSLTGASLPPA
ncbi:SsgA family sporulation/cell division regulator [Streptomyces arenae]|uniref:SsgA family sporulation/cell division regulator n=1 Tax=Streptomyces arenae TaxID=29301 RepID=UPI002658A73E|nr:SsgA family sporulation/cell division regulator [Streptomyces arenae]MCG7205562.1 SsgA family sporulation/cell division regulator [Streptomyces arenae]